MTENGRSVVESAREVFWSVLARIATVYSSTGVGGTAAWLLTVTTVALGISAAVLPLRIAIVRRRRVELALRPYVEALRVNEADREKLSRQMSALMSAGGVNPLTQVFLKTVVGAILVLVAQLGVPPQNLSSPLPPDIYYASMFGLPMAYVPPEQQLGWASSTLCSLSVLFVLPALAFFASKCELVNPPEGVRRRTDGEFYPFVTAVVVMIYGGFILDPTPPLGLSAVVAAVSYILVAILANTWIASAHVYHVPSSVALRWPARKAYSPRLRSTHFSRLKISSFTGSDLLPGDPKTIGRYRVDSRLGAGGMGAVYLGHRRFHRNERVAIKVILPYMLGETASLRFDREVRLMSRITSRHVASVVDSAGRSSSPPYVIMDYIDGCSIADYCAQRGALGTDPDLCIAIGECMARGLRAMHDAGIVHRDLKPANVMLTLTGPKIVDFGIAFDPDATPLTASHNMVGTPGYMAPERLRGADVSPAVDVWSWGCVMFFLAVGTDMFSGRSHAEVIRSILDDDRTYLPTSLDARLHRLIHATTQQSPTGRPGDGGELLRLVDDVRRVDMDPGRWAKRLAPSSTRARSGSGPRA